PARSPEIRLIVAEGELLVFVDVHPWVSPSTRSHHVDDHSSVGVDGGHKAINVSDVGALQWHTCAKTSPGIGQNVVFPENSAGIRSRRGDHELLRAVVIGRQRCTVSTAPEIGGGVSQLGDIARLVHLPVMSATRAILKPDQTGRRMITSIEVVRSL